jgi:cytoskeletal protein CcmA (bactofilin family)
MNKSCDNDAMSTIGPSIHVRGELRAGEDITLEGHVEGPVVCEGFAVTVAASADVTGDVRARDITVWGKSNGRLIATDVVDLRPACAVSGHVLSKRFILHDGAIFHGRAEPQHLEAALRVAKFNDGQKPKADGATPAVAPGPQPVAKAQG